MKPDLPHEVLKKMSRPRTDDRDKQVFSGWGKGIIADGKVNQKEAEALLKWLRDHPDLRAPDGSDPRDLVERFLADGDLNDVEARDLLEYLKRATDIQAIGEKDDAPVVFEDKNFCFTGNMQCDMLRSDCEKEVIARGGNTQPNVTQSLHYLVVGGEESELWVHGTHGRKFEKAVENQRKGFSVQIVSERRWLAAIGRAP